MGWAVPLSALTLTHYLASKDVHIVLSTNSYCDALNNCPSVGGEVVDIGKWNMRLSMYDTTLTLR